MDTTTVDPQYTTAAHSGVSRSGEKLYELSNHLGNVLSVINNVKLPVNSSGSVNSFISIDVSAQDYSPFGVVLKGRNWSTEAYRYGFQNQEQDEELWEGAVSFKYRVEDARLGRFFSVDPYFDKYPWNGTYTFSENRLLDALELEGLEARLIITDEVVGYTAQWIYGSTGKREIVVPVFAALLVDAQDPSKCIAYCGVTRDGWYGLGEVKNEDGTSYSQLMNRTFEPCENSKLYTTSENSTYSGPNDPGYYLIEDGKWELCAEPQSTQKKLNGTDIEGARKSPNVAGGVMFHIGGWYTKIKNGKTQDKLGGSEGCFAFIPQNQIYKTQADAQSMIDNKAVNKYGTSNKEYRSFLVKIRDLKKTTKGKKVFEILIEKRKSFEKTKKI